MEPLPVEAIVGAAIGLLLAVFVYGPKVQATFDPHATQEQYDRATQRQNGGDFIILIVVILGVLALAGTFDGGFSLRELGASFADILAATRAHAR